MIEQALKSAERKPVGNRLENRPHSGHRREPEPNLMPSVEEIRSRIEDEAQSANVVLESQELNKPEQRHKSEQLSALTEASISAEVKNVAYKQTLARIRHQMPESKRVLSQIVHQPVISEISDATARTIGRPSGLIGAGSFTVIGSSLYYLIVISAGYNYNYFIFLFLMAIGFIFGVAIELLFRLAHHSSD
ncbi:MAG TPA: hypothetical protein VFB03_02895 [Candidatus Saccharimonadales bacterium]|nr:hypothetical protein [Candidatus Saccharimonadales bacterium]